MTPALRHKTDPGIVFIDNDSAARVLHYGEDFLEEHLPVGTRVVYPPPPIRGLPNPRGAIRHALSLIEAADYIGTVHGHYAAIEQSIIGSLSAVRKAHGEHCTCGG